MSAIVKDWGIYHGSAAPCLQHALARELSLKRVRVLVLLGASGIPVSPHTGQGNGE